MKTPMGNTNYYLLIYHNIPINYNFRFLTQKKYEIKFTGIVQSENISASPNYSLTDAICAQDPIWNLRS